VKMVMPAANPHHDEDGNHHGTPAPATGGPS
jgi:hypothetical protein